MSKINYILCLVLILLLGCKESQPKKESSITIEINPMKFERNKLLSEVATSIKVVPLQNSDKILFGNVEHIKTFEDKLYMHDPDQTKSITIFNIDGSFVTQLKKFGQGPGEYSDLYSFSPYKNKIYTYSRSAKSFYVYSFPDLKFIETIKTDNYLANFESIDKKLLCFIEGNNNQDGYKVSYFSLQNKKFEDTNIKSTPPSIELSYPNTITRKNNEELYYALPGEYTSIYEVTDKDTNPIIKIDFGENKIPSKYWRETEAEDFELAFEEKPLKATWVQYPIISDSIISFYYIFANPETKQFAIYNSSSNESKIYYQLHLEKGYKEIPNPIGVYNGYYLSLIYSEDINDLLPEDKSLLNTPWKEKLRESNEEGKVYLLMYKI